MLPFAAALPAVASLGRLPSLPQRRLVVGATAGIPVGDNTYVGPYAERRARALLGLGSISFGPRATSGAGVPAAAAAAASERGVGLAGIVRAPACR